MKVKGTGSWCVLVEYVKDNYYARFHDHRYHRYRERYFSIFTRCHSREILTKSMEWEM